MDKEVRELVWQRSKGYCETCGIPLDPENWDFHHRKLRKHGGEDSPENGLALHHHCHLVKVHNHPKISYSMGWMVPSFDDPAKAPLHLFGKIIVMLTADGKYEKTA